VKENDGLLNGTPSAPQEKQSSEEEDFIRKRQEVVDEEVVEVEEEEEWKGNKEKEEGEHKEKEGEGEESKKSEEDGNELDEEEHEDEDDSFHAEQGLVLRDETLHRSTRHFAPNMADEGNDSPLVTCYSLSSQQGGQRLTAYSSHSPRTTHLTLAPPSSFRKE